MSNLLDKSSIVLTATAYDNSKVLCVKPSDGSGDFDFSRNSAATRVNAQGLVENVQILSSNLVQNGDFSEQGSELVNSWTNKDFASFSSSGSDITQMVSSGSGNNNYSALTITSGKTYKLQFTSSQAINCQIRISANTNLTGASVVLNPIVLGTNEVYFTASSNYDYIGFYAPNSFTDTQISNFTLKEVAQNWTSPDYNSALSIVGGQLKIESTVSLGRVVQAVTTVVGKTYLASANITNIDSSTGIQLKLSNGANLDGAFFNSSFNTTTNIVTIKHNFVATATTTYIGSSQGSGVGQSGLLGNVSVIQITNDTNLPRINYEGFSFQDALGSELITNGDFATDGSWVKGTGWTISGGSANGSSTTGDLYQENVVAVGKKYKVTYTISNYVSGSVRVELPSNSYAGTERSANGTYTETILSGGTLVLFDARTSFTGSIDNVSVKEYLGQEVVPNSGCGSWLFEPQSTNINTKSNGFSTWSVNSNITRTADYIISPDGTQNATRLEFTGNGFCSNVTQINAIQYSVTCYAKRNNTGTQNIGFFKDGSGVVDSAWAITSEWKRFTYTYTAANGSFVGIAGLSGADVSVYGFQVEVGSYATSYIPTDGSTVTRNQDVCNNGGSLATINSAEGVLYAEIAALANSGTFRYISLFGDTSNHVQIYYKDSANKIAGLVRASGNVSFFFTHTLTDATNFVKVAIKFKQNDFALWVNGIEVATDTSGNTPIGLSELDFDYNGGNKFFGKTKSVAVWKEALSDQELAELTTI